MATYDRANHKLTIAGRTFDVQPEGFDAADPRIPIWIAEQVEFMEPTDWDYAYPRFRTLSEPPPAVDFSRCMKPMKRWQRWVVGFADWLKELVLAKE